MSKQVMQRALDALEDCVDIVEAEYANAVDLYSNYPSRQARIDSLKLYKDKHNAAISELRAAIAAPEVEPVAWMRKDGDMISSEEKRPDYAYTHYYDKPLFTTPPDTEAMRQELERVSYERDRARACYDGSVKILTRIHGLLYPPPITIPDGRTMVFRPKDPDPHVILQELSDRIRSIPEAIAAQGGGE